MFRKPVHEIESLSAYLDGQVSAEERRRIEAHLAACRECADELRQLQQVTYLLRSCPPVRPPRSFTLTPEQVALRRPRPFFVSLAPYATAIAAVLLALVVFADAALLRPAGSAPALRAGVPAADTRSGSADVSTRGADEVREAEPTGLAMMSAPAAQVAAPTATAPVAAAKAGGQVPPTASAGEGEAPVAATEATPAAQPLLEAATEPSSEAALTAADGAEASATVMAYSRSAEEAATAPAAIQAAGSTPESAVTPELLTAATSAPEAAYAPAPLAATPVPWWRWPLRALEVLLAFVVLAGGALWVRRGASR
jgi:anti-sigma factor RsiW